MTLVAIFAATAALIIFSPIPVHDIPIHSFAKSPAKVGLSPTLSAYSKPAPPVDVTAQILPLESKFTTPIVPV